MRKGGRVCRDEYMKNRRGREGKIKKSWLADNYDDSGEDLDGFLGSGLGSFNQILECQSTYILQHS